MAAALGIKGEAPDQGLGPDRGPDRGHAGARPALDFWFEFASTYSWLSVERIEQVAAARGVAVTWRPFLLGPVFKSQGLETSPFVTNPVKGRYMWRDLARRAQARGLSFRQPTLFPQNGLLAARVAMAALAHPGGPAFCRNIYRAQFQQGADISQASVVAQALQQAGLPAELIDAPRDPSLKASLRAQTEDAQAQGLFGAPSFTVGGELFWGDDRLEDALDWACRAAEVAR